MRIIRCKSPSDNVAIAYARYLLAALRVRAIEDHMHREHLSKLDYEHEDVDTLTMQSFAISREHGYYQALDELAVAKMVYKAERQKLVSVA